MPNFQKFSRRGSPAVKQPFVTLQGKGTISFNRAAHLALGEPTFIELLFDPEERIIGFRKTTDDDLDAYPMRRQQNSNSYLVAGNSFRAYYDIKIDGARRYQGKMIDDILTIALDGPSVSAEGPRGRKSEQADDGD